MNVPPPDADDDRIDRALFGPTADAPAPPDEPVDAFALLAGSLVEAPNDPDAPPPHVLAALRRDAAERFTLSSELDRDSGANTPWWSARPRVLLTALGLVLAFGLGFSLGVPAVARVTPFTDLAPAAALERVRGESDLLRVSLAAGDDPAAKPEADPSELLWSTDLGAGVMVLSNLAANDPSTWQYQLWIFDALRDERYPVDGGVFDVPADGPAIVPFAPRVTVSEPTLFAVTVEPPGGVVVSDRERLPAIGEVGS